MPFHFTVSRATWYRGKDYAKLLTLEGERCCLGFLGQACGLSDEAMRGKGHPTASSCYNEFRLSPAKFLVGASTMHGEAIYGYEPFVQVNDDPTLTDLAREAKLTELFAAHAVLVTFTD